MRRYGRMKEILSVYQKNITQPYGIEIKNTVVDVDIYVHVRIWNKLSVAHKSDM